MLITPDSRGGILPLLGGEMDKEKVMDNVMDKVARGGVGKV